MGQHGSQPAGRTLWPLLLIAASLALLVWLWMDDAPSTPPIETSGPPATPATAEHRYLKAEAYPVRQAEVDTPAAEPTPGPCAGESDLLRSIRANPRPYRALVEAGSATDDDGRVDTRHVGKRRAKEYVQAESRAFIRRPRHHSLDPSDALLRAIGDRHDVEVGQHQ